MSEVQNELPDTVCVYIYYAISTPSMLRVPNKSKKHQRQRCLRISGIRTESLNLLISQPCDLSTSVAKKANSGAVGHAGNHGQSIGNTIQEIRPQTAALCICYYQHLPTYIHYIPAMRHPSIRSFSSASAG